MITFKELYSSSKKKIPYIFTFANACFGFLSVVNALEGNYWVAAYCIFAAAVTDMIDGRLARALGTSSLFGMELDSLCDAVSFGLAPIILIYSRYWHASSSWYMLVLAFYLCAGLSRLARFNLSHSAQIVVSTGVPIPIAALLLAHLVLYDVWFETHFFSWLISDVGLAIFITSIACLMISTIPFTTFKVVRPNKKHTFFTVLVALASLVIALIMLHSYIMRTKIDRALAESMSGFPILFFVLSLYLMMGILAYGVHLLKPNAR